LLSWLKRQNNESAPDLFTDLSKTRELRRLPVLVSLFSIASVHLFWGILPSSASATELQVIKQRKRLVVGVKTGNPPLAFRDINGQLQGFEIDLAQQVAKELLGEGATVELKTILNQNRFSEVLDGRVDVAIAQVTQTPSRLRLFNFSLPYYRDGVAIATSNTSILSSMDLAGKPIAVLNNSSTVEVLRRRLPAALPVPVTSYPAAKEAIEAGRAIAIAADVTVLAGWVNRWPQYRLLLPVLSAHELAIVLPKGQQHEELRQEINHILIRLSNSGWLEQRASYWGLPRNFSF